MPRNVRNFWIQGERDDGVKVPGWGPARGNQGFTLRVLMREHGQVSEKHVAIRGYVSKDGTTLTLRIETPGFEGNDIILQTVR